MKTHPRATCVLALAAVCLSWPAQAQENPTYADLVSRMVDLENRDSNEWHFLKVSKEKGIL